MNKILISLSAAAAAALLCLTAAGVSSAVEDPTISLIKTIEVHEVDGRRIETEEYVVREGDSLNRILRARKMIGPGETSPALLRLIEKLNPELEDPDVILPGQTLVLPTDVSEIDEETSGGSGEASGVTPSSWPRPFREGEGGRYKVLRVGRGDRLAQLLRREGIPDHLIFNEFINLTLEMNPWLTDPNVLYVGQELKLPLRGAWTEATASRKKKLAARPVPGAAESSRARPVKPARPSATRIPSVSHPSEKPKTPTITAPAPPLPPSSSVAARTALGLIFTRIGERFVSTGQHFLPLKSGGQITINAQSFPILDLRTGQKIVLDLDRRLPQDMVALIRSNWSNYTVFRPQSGERLRSILDRLLSQAGYYRVISDGSPWVLEREVRATIRADWIIWPSQSDFASGRPVVITIPSSPALGTSPAAAEYLDRRGVRVIDFHPRGNMIGPGPVEPVPAGDSRRTTIVPENLAGFIRALLEMTGQKYELDLNIPLMQGGEDGDFTFTVHAPIYFSRNDANFVVAPQGLSAEMKELLGRHDFKVVAGVSGEPPHSLAIKVLEAMGVAVRSGLTVPASPRPEKRNIQFTVPGLVFTGEEGPTLLTSADLPPVLNPLLAKTGRRIVEYQIANPS